MKAGPAAAELDWRDRVLSDPDMILDDRDVMRALIAANERQMGQNIVDLRGIAMARLEARLDRLEDTHRAVIAAAYENLAGANQIHRSILALMGCADFAALLDVLHGEVAGILRVDAIRLVLECADPGLAPHPVVAALPRGAVAEHITLGRDRPLRQVTLRQCDGADTALFGRGAGDLRSEALLMLDLGAGRLPAMLAMGCEDPHQFRAGQGTDLLAFLAMCLEHMLRRSLDA